MIFKNGKDVPIDENSGTLPNMSGTLDGWLQKMIFEVVTKVTSAYQVVETGEEFEFMGVWQPFSKRQLQMKPEGQQAWKWFTVHAQTGIPLSPDMVIIYRGTQYRVMADLNYNEYGYYEYELIQDYTGSGPTVVTP